MRVLITGSSGLIGSALVTQLRADGHQIVRLVRRAPEAADEVRWNPSSGEVFGLGAAADQIHGGIDAAVHLAGAGVGDHRWTPAYKEEVLASRVLGTRTLVRALVDLPTPPGVLISGSAVGLYGDRGDQILSEDAEPGSGFLAGVVSAWEAETAPAAEAGIRVVVARTGLVLSPAVGAFARMLPLIKLGLAGPLGNGRQWWSWITLHDEVRALRFLIETALHGPVNLVAPNPERNGAMTRVLAEAFRRPALLPVPAFALRTALGEFATDVLGSQRCLPSALLQNGFSFDHPTPAAAARWLAAHA